MIPTKTQRIPLLVLVTLLGSLIISQGAEIFTKARSALQQWVETRQIIAEEKTTWLANEKTLTESIAFMTTEIQSIEKAILDAQADIDTQDDTQKKLKDDIAESEEAIAIIEAAVPVFEKKLLELSSIFPAVFLETVATQMRRIPDPSIDREFDIPVEERIQNVISILKNIEYFHRNVTLSSELREADGEIVEVKTIYIGFGQAYFADEALTTAGYGFPVIGKGWEWIERPEIAEAVNDAILVTDNRLPAVFVNVPVSLQE
jgi:hypothetical protein